MLETLIVVRHGSCTYLPDELTDIGKREVEEKLRPKLLPYLDNAVVFSSIRRRARQTADILAGNDIDVHESRDLGGGAWSYPQTLELIREFDGQFRTIVLATHVEYSGFPLFFAQDYLGIDPKGYSFTYRELEKAGGCIVTCSPPRCNYV